MSDETIAYITEDKFNATATYSIEGIEDRKRVKAVARQHFREEYGHSPSKVVAEKDRHTIDEHRWTVIVTDHSSGSLKGTTEFTL